MATRCSDRREPNNKDSDSANGGSKDAKRKPNVSDPFDGDTLLGGAGDDLLDGGEGDDIYFAHFASGNDTLVFNDIRFGQIAIGVGSLKLVLPDGGEVHLDDFDPDNPYAAGGIEWFQDADGVVLSKAELIDTIGITPTGTPEADVLSGTALSETIVVLAGDDVVTARAGHDLIDALGRNSRRHGTSSAAVHHGHRIRHASRNRKFAVRAEIFLRSPSARTASGDSVLRSMP